MSLVIVNSLPEGEWRQFVDSHPAGNIFHTPEMYQVFSRARGYQPELWAAVDPPRILALLLPVRISLMDGALGRLTTRSIAYGSALCVPGEEGQPALSSLLQAYARKAGSRTLFTELRNICNQDALQPILHKHGFIYEDHLNYLIDLKCSSDEVFDRIGRRTRKNIRRALRQGKVAIQEVEDRQHLDVCYSLLRKTFAEARVPLADRSLFHAAFALLYPKRMIRFTMARVDDAPAAVSVELLYRDVAYGWFGGTDRAYTSFVPNELLTWHILQWSVANGYHLYDFGGAGRPGEVYGVRDFKAKFGGELVNFGRNTCVHSPLLLKVSRLAYQQVRRFLFS